MSSELVGNRGDRARALLADLPRLHRWGGTARVGGLTATIGERIIAELDRFEAPRVIETGAGLTTLLFCSMEPSAVTSIDPTVGLHERVLDEATKRAIATDRLTYISERSEFALPKLAAARQRFEIGLIDGSHSWPAIFVDFCYFNMMMPEGGTLFVDDVHLYSVSQLCLLLEKERDFQYVARDGKLATFYKRTDRPFLPEWYLQPHITQNTLRTPD